MGYNKYIKAAVELLRELLSGAGGNMEQQVAIERALRVKARYEPELLKLANVVGVGVGFKYKNGRPTDEVALIVNVIDKKAPAELAVQEIIPAELEGVPIDVQEVGPMRAYEDW